MNNILLLEDDPSIVDGLSYALNMAGYQLTATRCLSEARRELGSGQSFDLLLLDVTLPDGLGFDLCSEVRATGSVVPIIFLTASDDELSVVRGLDTGGDDYISKPFRLQELLSRIRALLRRASAEQESGIIRCGRVCIEPMKSRATLDGAVLSLTAGEYRLLCLLIKNVNRTLTRSQILDSLWDGYGCFADDNTLSVYVRRLRQKLEDDPSSPKHLLTVRGFGYQWKEEGQ